MKVMRREAGRGNAHLKVFAPLTLPLTSLIIKVLSPQAKYFTLISAIIKVLSAEICYKKNTPKVLYYNGNEM